MPRKEKAIKAEAPKARVDQTSAQVFNAGGTFIREYNLKTHGKDFAEKAKGYAGKIKGTYRFPILT